MNHMARRSAITMLPSVNLPSPEVAAGSLLALVRWVRQPRIAAGGAEVAKPAEVGVTYPSIPCTSPAADS